MGSNIKKHPQKIITFSSLNWLIVSHTTERSVMNRKYTERSRKHGIRSLKVHWMCLGSVPYMYYICHYWVCTYPVRSVENHTGRGALHNSNPCVRTECDLSFNEVCLKLTIAQRLQLRAGYNSGSWRGMWIMCWSHFSTIFVIPDPNVWIILSLDPKKLQWSRLKQRKYITRSERAS